MQADRGRQRINEGTASALLVIPPGFGAAVLSSEATELILVKNPSQSILPRMVEDTVRLWVDGTYYVQAIFGEELWHIFSKIEKQGDLNLSDAQVATFSVATQQTLQRLSDTLFPPLIAVSTQIEEKSQPSPNLGLLFFPGVLLWGLLFTAQGLSNELWQEREMGTLKRMASSPQSITLFLISKVGYGLLVLLAVFVVLLGLGFAYHGIDGAKFPLSLGLLVLAGLDFMMLFFMIQLFSPSRRAASLISTVVVFPLIMLGGSFFPFEAMPQWMASIGQWTPNGLVLRQLKTYLMGQAQVGDLSGALLMLLGIGVVLFALAVVRNQAAFARR